ncbi:MAG: hypothetical protein ACI8Y7_000680 [Candidatus Woesearchaeota archaeon]|jgi:hypothetical protein
MKHHSYLHKIQKHIIKKLYVHNAFTHGHILYERLQSGVPRHLQGLIKPGLKELLKENLVLLYGKTKYGLAYQLNITKLKEIEDIIFS